MKTTNSKKNLELIKKTIIEKWYDIDSFVFSHKLVRNLEIIIDTLTADITNEKEIEIELIQLKTKNMPSIIEFTTGDLVVLRMMMTEDEFIKFGEKYY